MTNINIEIPDEMHKKFKIKCAIEDVTLKAKIVELIEKFVEKDDKHKH